MIKQIFRLCKLQMYNTFGINEFIHTKDKTKKKRFMLVAVAWTLVIIMLIGYVVGTSYGLIYMGMGDILPMYVYTIVSILILMFTLFKAGSVIFSMKGYEMLISLPVSKAAVVVSRFMKMYISNLMLTSLVMIPAVIVYGVIEKPSLTFYIIYLVGMLFVPLLPLTIASIIGALITAISSRMRRKSVVNSILTTLVVLALLLVGLQLPDGNGDISLEAFKGMAISLEEEIGAIFPFAAWFNRAAFGEVSYLISLIGIPFVVFVLFVVVLQKYFLGICTLLSGVSSKNNYKIQELKARSVIMTLLKREIKRYFASSIYVTNTIIGYILAVVAAVSIFVMGIDGIGEMLGISGVQPIIKVVLPFIYALLMCVSSITACSISMEGKNIWLLQTLPVKTKDVYIAKILANLVVAAPFYIVTVIMGCLTVNGNITDIIWIAIIPACYIVYNAVVGIAINLKFPIFNWEDEVHVVKQSASTFISMIVGIVSCLVPAVVVVVVSVYALEMVNVARVAVVAIILILTTVLYKRNGKVKMNNL